MRLQQTSFIVIIFFTIGLAGCKKWDDHTAIGNQNLTQDLSQAIEANPGLSKFMQYMKSTGVDTLLRSTKTYTVWAPTDAALATLDAAIVSDPVKLKSFVLNHISAQSYFTRDAQTTIRVPVLSGKYNSFSVSKFEEATITTADKFVKNGVLHVIDKNVLVLPSIWEYINATTAQYIQHAFIAGLNFNDFDPTLAIIDSISSTTGLPIYRPGTGIVVRNRFNERVYNTKAENRQFTYFVIANAGFTIESDSLKNYFKTASPTSTDSLAKWNTVKDLIVEGVYPASALSGLISRSGVNIPANMYAVSQTIKMSNGIVHVFNILDVNTKDKFKEITVQGENPSGFLSDRTGNTNYRLRYNPTTGKDYTDIMITGHGVTTYYSFYRLNEVPSIKYRVYALGVNDFQTGALTQNVIPKFLTSPATYTTLATLPHVVPLFNAAGAYDEKLLGEFTLANYGTIDIQLTCLTTQPLVLDYLRLVPVP